MSVTPSVSSHSESEMGRSRNSSSSSLILDGIMDSYKSLLIGLPHKTARGKGIGLSAFGIREETGRPRLVSQSEKSWDGGGSAAGLPHARFIPLFASYPISVAEIGSADWRWPVFRNGEWNLMVA